MMDKEQEQEIALFIFGEAFSDQIQGMSFAEGRPAFDSIETASLDFTEQPYKQSRTVVPQGFQDGGDVDNVYTPPVYTPEINNISKDNPSLPYKDLLNVITGKTTNTKVPPLSEQIELVDNGDASIGTDQDIEPQTFAGFLSGWGIVGRDIIANIPTPINIARKALLGEIPGIPGLPSAVASQSTAYGGGEYGPTGPGPGTGTPSAAPDSPESGAGIAASAPSTAGTVGTASTPGGIAAATSYSGGPGSPGPGPGPGDPGFGGGDEGAIGEGEWKHGGQIKGYQEGDLVEDDQADTQLDDLGLGPIGIVDDPDGTTGVADDLDMALPHESYVINTEGTNETGRVSINKMLREAIDMAIADGVDLPSVIKTAEKVPIKISKGETAIPYPLPNYIGLSKLEKINTRGLRIREQRENEEAPVQMADAPSTQEDLLAQIKPVA